MNILQTIYDNNLIGKPLFIEDFVSEKLSYNSVKTLLSRYVKSGYIKRASQGTYYIPKNGLIGEVPLSFEDIINKRYVKNDDDIYGYNTGLVLLNEVGLSTQVPNTIEICTNKEKNIKRKIQIGKRKAIIRKSNIEINKDNVLYLQFFDIFRYADEEMINKNKNKILEYYDNNKLIFKTLVSFEEKMPTTIRNKIRRTKIYDELAQRQRSI